MKTEAFSWERMKKLLVEVKIQRAITMASKKDVNPDFRIQHPDWVKQAQSKDYTDLKKKIKETVEKQQQTAMNRRKKVAG